MITGAILDFDGTLFDSMHVWNKAGERYLFGKGRMPAPGLKERLKALSLFQSACCLKEDYELADSPQEIMAEINALVEEEYFKYVIDFFRSRPEGGVSIGLRHLPGADEAGEKAIRRYESYLERYAAQLKRCGSPYGFHTVGSAFAVRGESYMKCGGMKVRQAGEDFYFLQAVAKTSGVGLIEKILVHPSARVSARTPFGTGQAVRDLLAGKGLNEIPDAAFDRLANLLAAATAEGVLDSDSPSLPEEEFFRSEKFFKVWPGIRRNTPRSKLTNAFHIWFDGLKTLRFLHRVSLP